MPRHPFVRPGHPHPDPLPPSGRGDFLLTPPIEGVSQFKAVLGIFGELRSDRLGRTGPTSAPACPCELASLARVPFRLERGRSDLS